MIDQSLVDQRLKSYGPDYPCHWWRSSLSAAVSNPRQTGFVCLTTCHKMALQTRRPNAAVFHLEILAATFVNPTHRFVELCSRLEREVESLIQTNTLKGSINSKKTRIPSHLLACSIHYPVGDEVAHLSERQRPIDCYDATRCCRSSVTSAQMGQAVTNTSSGLFFFWLSSNAMRYADCVMTTPKSG